MPKIVRLGDQSDHGGKMVTAGARFTVNGKPACVSGDLHECPIPNHGTTAVTSNSKTTSNGRPIIRVGDKAACGATLIQGSDDTGTV